LTAVEIAHALGAAHRSGSWWRCRCPVHQSRGFTLALRDGGRGLIVHCHAGCASADIFAELRRRGLLGDAPHDRHHRPAAIVRDDDRDGTARRFALARRIWDAGQEVRGTPVKAYLRARGITIAAPSCLRYAPSLRRPDGTYGPAMLARIDDIDGQLIGLSRTWLIRDDKGMWRRRDRAMLGRAASGAIRLGAAGELLMISEGVETGLSAQEASGLPCWAALSTAGLVAVALPQIVKEVTILADHDRSGAGEKAARILGQRCVARGLRVAIVMPVEAGTDINDVLLAGEESHNVAA
jgi:putative DNA primase/helicase